MLAVAGKAQCSSVTLNDRSGTGEHRKMMLSENLNFTVTKLKKMIISGDAGEGAVVFLETDTETTLEFLIGPMSWPL